MHKITEICFILAYNLATLLAQFCGDEVEVTILISLFYIQLCGQHVHILQIAKLL